MQDYQKRERTRSPQPPTLAERAEALALKYRVYGVGSHRRIETATTINRSHHLLSCRLSCSKGTKHQTRNPTESAGLTNRSLVANAEGIPSGGVNAVPTRRVSIEYLTFNIGAATTALRDLIRIIVVAPFVLPRGCIAARAARENWSFDSTAITASVRPPPSAVGYSSKTNGVVAVDVKCNAQTLIH
ncbi:MAG: hypothetical protein QXP01_03130 [Candidatus Hadarchaeum sp.]